jgi:hypothetical protein
MRTSTIRIAAAAVLGLILLSAACFAAYWRGHRDAMHDEVITNLRHNLTLYRLLKAGDTNLLASKLRFSVYAYADYYDRHFGGELISYQMFARDLSDAHTIANEERSNVVQFTSNSLRKNLNQKIQQNVTNQ